MGSKGNRKDVQKVSNSNEIKKQCPICYEYFVIDEDVQKMTCGCIIHVECFKKMVKNACDSNIFPILCPYVSCTKKQNLLKLAEFLSDKEFLPLLDLAFLHYTLKSDDIVRCPRQCGYLMSWDPKSKCNQFQCPTCDVEFCAKCRTESHEGECEDIPSGFKRCKMCSALIERTSGCANVTCRCGYQFCWTCMSPKGCKCSPGHGYYAVGEVLGNWDGRSGYYVCTCREVVCKCKNAQK